MGPLEGLIYDVLWAESNQSNFWCHMMVQEIVAEANKRGYQIDITTVSPSSVGDPERGANSGVLGKGKQPGGLAFRPVQEALIVPDQEEALVAPRNGEPVR